MKDAHLLIIGGLLVGAAFLAMQKPVETPPKPKPRRAIAQKVGAVIDKVGWTGAALARAMQENTPADVGRMLREKQERAYVSGRRMAGKAGKKATELYEAAKQIPQKIKDTVGNWVDAAGNVRDAAGNIVKRAALGAMSAQIEAGTPMLRLAAAVKRTGLVDSGARAANTAYASARRTGHKTVRAVNRVQQKAEEVVTEKAQEVWDDPTWGF